MAILYKLTFNSGKSYIGITNKTLKQRVWRHINHTINGRNSAIAAAIRKYGVDFKREILIIGDFEYIKCMEIEAISAFGTKAPGGYNLTDGGEGALGHVKSDETRAKLVKANRGRKHSVATIARISESNKGKHNPSKEVRDKLSKSTRALMKDAEYRRNAARGLASGRGRILSQQEKDKISISLRMHFQMLKDK